MDFFLLSKPMIVLHNDCDYVQENLTISSSNCLMDESLELPTPLPNVPGDLALEDNEGSSDEEDGQLDWTKLL